jgi:hypothetical protein
VAFGPTILSGLSLIVSRVVTHRRPRSTPTLPAGPFVATTIVVAAVVGWVEEVVMENVDEVLAGWVYEFGVIESFHPIVLWCAKLTCRVFVVGKKLLFYAMTI